MLRTIIPSTAHQPRFSDGLLESVGVVKPEQSSAAMVVHTQESQHIVTYQGRQIAIAKRRFGYVHSDVCEPVHHTFSGEDNDCPIFG